MDDYQQIGFIYWLFQEALKEKWKGQYQPPHWDHEPTPEDLLSEKQYLTDCEVAQLRCCALARKLHDELTC